MVLQQPNYRDLHSFLHIVLRTAQIGL